MAGVRIPCFLNEDCLKMGAQVYEYWAPDKAPHIAFSGATGSGKTYSVKLLLAKISKYCLGSQLTLCDFKGDTDFDYLAGCNRFYRFDECVEGFKAFYREFLDTQKNPKRLKVMKVLLFDEWAACINYLDKKEAEEMKKMLSSLLMLGRSFDYHIILSQQRLESLFIKFLLCFTVDKIIFNY